MVFQALPRIEAGQRALFIAAPDDPEPLAPMCGVLLMYDVALSHKYDIIITLYSCDRYALSDVYIPIDSINYDHPLLSSLPPPSSSPLTLLPKVR